MRNTFFILFFLVGSWLNTVAQNLPSSPKMQIESAIQNWNSLYGSNVKALNWSYEGTIANDAKLKQVIAEITNPSTAWLPDGNIDAASAMTARRIADVSAITPQQIADWAKKIQPLIKLKMHLARIKWTKGSQAFTTLCVTDNNTIIYDNIFSNIPMIEHHSRCFDYRIGWAWQKGFNNMTRGSITADLTVHCVNGVPTCSNSCASTMTLGDAKISCSVKTTGPCCTLTWTYGWATGFGTVTINPKTGAVTISQTLGSSGSGTGSCTACCPATGTGYAIPATPGNPSGGFINDRDIDSAGPPKLKTVSVSTLSGEVVDVKIPNDIRPGDQITGTVSQKTTSSTLEGAVIEIDGKQTNVAGKRFSFVVPAGISAIPFIVKDRNGKPVGNSEINVITPGIYRTGGRDGTIPEGQLPVTPSHAPGNFVPMNYCQPSRTTTIAGFFDGDASDTKASINNIPCEVIAESPRDCFVQVPSDLPAGPASLTISEGAATQTMSIQVITVNLSADKTVVQKGTNAKVTATVQGLENLDLNNNNFTIQLTNGSPAVIQFSGQGGVEMTRQLNSSNVNNGTYTFTTDITGVAAGAYTITANVNSTTGINCWQKYKDCLDKCEQQEKKCYEDCDKGNKGFGCYLACSAAARACEMACWGEYLECLRQQLGY